MTPRYDVAVVGLGLFGSAALRGLAMRGVRAVGVGPAEPEASTPDVDVYASHYDSGRITRRIDRSHAWADLAVRSIAAYGPLEEQTGIDFHRPVGTLWADTDRSRVGEISAVAENLDVPCELGVTAAGQRAHGFRLPEGVAYAYEPGPAGHIDPRRLLQAQLNASTAAGADLVREAVVERGVAVKGQRLHTSSGALIEAEKVLLATGAYANAYGLADRRLPMRLKSEVTILAGVTRDAARAHAELPTLIYGIAGSPLSDFYLVPPALYPDGRYYLKAGADTRGDLTLMTREEMNEWMRAGNAEAHHGDFRDLLEALLPELPLESSSMKRCLIAYTAHGLPYIDEIDRGLFVVVGGNGRGAKSSDAIGAAAAGLVLGAWDDPLPRDAFRVPADGEVVPDASPL